MDNNEQFKSSGFDSLREIVRSLYCNVGERFFRIDITKDYNEKNLFKWSAQVFIKNDLDEYGLAFDCSSHANEEKAFRQAQGGIHNYIYEMDTPVVTKAKNRQHSLVEAETKLTISEFVRGLLSTIYEIPGYQDLTNTQIDDLVDVAGDLPDHLRTELKTYLDSYKASDFKPYSFFGCRFTESEQTERYEFIRLTTDKMLKLLSVGRQRAE